MIRNTVWAIIAWAIGAVGLPARADEVTLSNGDKINGKVGTIAGGKMKFTSPALGDLLIDMANVTTYTTDTPAVVQLNSRQRIEGKVTAADAAKVTLEHQEVPKSEIKYINPPAEKWTGALIVNGMLARGNTHSETLGVAIDAVLRRDNEKEDDRFTLGGAYRYGRERSADGDDNTTTDNWFVLGKYDKFWNPKYYTYGNLRIDHDAIADLYYRITPGVGVGYQWYETPNFNLSGEAGISYVFEDYDPGGKDEHVAIRLAGHVDRKLNDAITLFANGEYLPAIEDPGDYNINADAGIRVKMVQNFFTEFKIEYKRDSIPAPGSLKNDLRYILGVGWQF